ncbi:MAG: TauD/TfdA family dioxygenase [Pyrinomonadaceae bacterium]|nr:TauD/TfdA family dioxygenase [Pyrinomonadaceae bacterium]
MGTKNIPPFQSGLTVWYGPKMAKRKDEWQLDLTREEIAELENAASQFLATRSNIGELDQEKFFLPTLNRKLNFLREELIHGRGFFLLRGLPVEKYTEKEAATIFYGLGTHLGNARSQNAAGHVLGHVCDLGADAGDPGIRYYQTNQRQTFHTDSCDVVGLLCLQPAKKGGESLLVSGDTLFNEMRERRPDLLKLLMEPIATDRRGEVPEGMLPYLLIPVFSFFENKVTVFYQRQYIESAQRFDDAPRLTEKHIEALDLFDELANSDQLNFSMMLEKGDMQFVYNHAMLHDRTGFEDWDELKKRRHLLRLWLSVPDDRLLPEVFASRFGSVEIGNRGGIVVPGTKFCVPLRRDLAV